MMLDLPEHKRWFTWVPGPRDCLPDCPRCAVDKVLDQLDLYLSDDGTGGGLYPKLGIDKKERR